MRRAALLFAIGAAACATLAEPAGGDSNLPSSGAGPFRKLTGAEVRGSAPLVLDDPTLNYRQPSALPLDGGETMAVALYFVIHDQTSGHDVLARSRATDARSFYGASLDVGHHPKTVLSADQPWEGQDLSHPSALGVSGGVWLYYASNGSIGLARSSDGFAFTKAGPVLGPDALGPIDSASVAILPDGTFDMMFAQAGSIWEAKSGDGTSFQRVSGDAVLAPAPPFDTLRVESPYLAPRVTVAGRLQVRVLYTGFAPSEAGVTSTIGFAARYGDAGPLVRASGPVYAIGKNESAPTLFEWQDGSMLYVEQDPSDTSHRALGAGVAPATITLAPPDDYPDSP